MVPNKKIGPYLLLLPALVVLFFLMIYPIFWNIILSLHDVSITTLNNKTWEFTGLKEWWDVLTDPYFLDSLQVTLIFVVGSVVLQFVIGFCIARILVEKVRGTNFFRVIFIFPWLLSATIVGYSWRWLYNEFFGLFNLALGRLFGVLPVPWLSDPDLAIWSVLLTNVWFGTPFSMLFQESALLTIDSEIYEAAKIDGANVFQSLVYITLPILKPFIAINLVLITMWTVNIFDLQLVMTGGGPLNATTTISLYMYKQAFQQGQLSRGAIIGLIMLMINLSVSYVYLRLLKGSEKR